MVFLLLCRTKRNVIYEWNKDVFCGMGKRFLYSFLLVMGLAGMLRLTTYAAEKKGKTDEMVKEPENVTGEERLRVTIYDEYGRKILIRDGASWEVQNDIVLSFPIDELQIGEGKISVCYESKSSDARKIYSFDIVKETE